MREYFIVECWFGGGAMVLVDGQLWNAYGRKPGTLFPSRRAAKVAADATRRSRGHFKQPNERYRIQKVTV